MNAMEEIGAKQKLITTAAKLFAEKGFTGVSTRDIASEAGLNISLISYYFQGKEGLYHAVIGEFAQNVKEALEKMQAGLERDKHSKDQFHKQIREFLQGMLQMKIANPYVVIILQREMMEGLPNAREIYETLFFELASRAIQTFEAAQKNGFIRADLNVSILFFSLIHAVDGYLIGSKLKTSLSVKCPQLPEDLSGYIDNLMKIFIEGVGK